MIQPHQQRVIDEKAELDEKIAKLRTFTETDKPFNDLPREERMLLLHQLEAMDIYSSALRCRMELWKE